MSNYQCGHCGYKFHDVWTHNGMHRCPECHFLTEATPLDASGNPVESEPDDA